MIKTKNPWIELKNPPYCLAEDLPVINAFNQKVEPKYRIRIEGLPEAYIGSVKDPRIVLLNLNPGWSKEDHMHFEKPDFRNAVLRNLHHALEEYPFYHLNPKFAFTGGTKWWIKKLRYLIHHFDREIVAKHVLVLEYFPYPSLAYKQIPAILRGQRYTFFLLRKFLEMEGIAFVGMRSVKKWMNAVPELENKMVVVKNFQNPIISPRNLPDGCFTKLIEVMERT